MERIFIFGIGDKADEITSFIEEYDLYEIVGFVVDEKYIQNNEFRGYPVYPTEKIEFYFSKEIYAFVAISQMFSLNRFRKEKYIFLKEKGYKFANLISPLATVKSTAIGEGNWIKDYVYLAYKTEVGSNNVFDVNFHLSHYSCCGNHNYFGGRSVIAGNCKIGDSNFFGMNSVVFNVVNIGNSCIIGGGSVVKRNLNDCSLSVAQEAFIKECNAEKIETYLNPDVTAATGKDR